MLEKSKSSHSAQNSGWDLSKSGGHQVVAMPILQKIEVRGLPGSGVFARGLVERLNSVVFRDLPEALSVQRVEEAFTGLILLRVMQVRRRSFKDVPVNLHFKQVRYPAFMFPVIRAIGDIIDTADAIELSVDVCPSLESQYNQEVWKRVDETLSLVTSYGLKNGLEIASAFPRETDGQVSVLSFLVVNDRLVSHTAQRTHGDALIASAIHFSFSNAVWGIARWEYNNVRWYHGQLERVVHDSFRV